MRVGLPLGMGRRTLAIVVVAGVGAAMLGLGVAFSVTSGAAAQQLIYAAPGGSGSACTAALPCSLAGARQVVRGLVGRPFASEVVVSLADGVYRLSEPLAFTAQDSGWAGHPVRWGAAPGAHPVLSGAIRATGWSQVDAAKNIWQAPIPPGVDTRQVYVNGVEAPIAQTTPAEQHLTFAAATGGYTTDPSSWAATLQSQIGAANLHGVELVYTGVGSMWTETRCRVDSLSGSTILMQQPCWFNATNHPNWQQATGNLPSVPVDAAPVTIENAYPFLHAGQWYLDHATNMLDYIPLPGQQMANLDVEVPHLTSLITGTGTLDHPIHDLTFSGLQFSYASWLTPSTGVGYAEVQDGLTLTSSDQRVPQGTCNFGTPPGTCPFGALTRGPANVSFSAAHNITFSGNVFSNLGAAGLGFDYGSQHNAIEGNIFTAISAGAIQLGNSNDPHPSDVGADDREINTYNTIDNNLIHNVGTDYPGAAGITVFFTQHTTITHNELYDLPYSGMSIGVIQGHVDNADHPENSTNINSDNTISNNVIHDYLKVLQDGGAIYVEGHQGQNISTSDGKLDQAQSLAHGLSVSGNVAYNQGNGLFAWYDDAGTQWINWTGNVQWNGNPYGQGGCAASGHITYTGNYNADPPASWLCHDPNFSDVHVTGNTGLPHSPGPIELPLNILAGAGLTLASVTSPRRSPRRSPTPSGPPVTQPTGRCWWPAPASPTRRW